MSTHPHEIAAGIALGLLVATATGSAAEAHPFAFDTSQMIGFNVLTEEDGAMDDRSMVVIEYKGPVVYPMAENLRTIWDEIKKDSRFERVVLRLNSPGGTDTHGMEVIDVLKEIREHASLATLVGEGDLCASMCIPIYIQGEARYASPASAWMFHGASRYMSNVPSLAMTVRYFDLLKDRDISTGFIDFLFGNNYVTTPGAYWMSGVELAERSNVITKLLPNWRPAEADPGPVRGFRGGI